jgi:hypothetical protein
MGTGGTPVTDAGVGTDGPVDAAAPTLTQIWTSILGNMGAGTAPGCALCHNGNANRPNYATIALAYATLVGPAGTGVASVSCPPGIRVTPSNAETSVLVNKLRAGLGLAAVCGGSPMPSGGHAITLDQLHMIEAWINAGALNN